MNDIAARHEHESSSKSTARILIAGLLVALAALGWNSQRSKTLYETARFLLPLGSPSPVIEAAIIERHPMVDWQRPVPSTSPNVQPWLIFNTGRRQLALLSQLGSSTFDFNTNETWWLFDRNLDFVTRFKGAPHFMVAPDDRDGDGSIELVATGVRFAMPTGTGTNGACAVVRLGRARHAVIAVVWWDATGTPGKAGMPIPIWTNAEQDQLHELELVEHSSTKPGAAPPLPSLKLRWLAPGRMAVDGDTPAMYRVWLAESPNEFTFDPDESIDAAIERAEEKLE